MLRQAVLDNLSPSGCLLSVGYISEYPHVKPDIDEEDQHSSEGSGAAEQSKSDLPPAHELFWQRQVIKRGNQTLYGDVWSGVRPSCYMLFETLAERQSLIPAETALSFVDGEGRVGNPNLSPPASQACQARRNPVQSWIMQAVQ